MAFLLLLHQKMSLQRKVNKLTLEQTQIASAKERMTKRIERVQQSFAKRQSKLDAEAKLATSQTNNYVSSMLMGAMNGSRMITADQAMTMIQGGNSIFEEQQRLQKAVTDAGSDTAARQTAMEALRKFRQDNQTFYQDAQNYATSYNNDLSTYRQQCQQMANAFQTDANERIAIELEARKQALEDEEQLALAPLEEQDTQIDMRQASNEAQLSYAQSRLQNIESALQNSTQNAPKFGA